MYMCYNSRGGSGRAGAPAFCLGRARDDFDGSRASLPSESEHSDSRRGRLWGGRAACARRGVRESDSLGGPWALWRGARAEVARGPDFSGKRSGNPGTRHGGSGA